MQFVREVNTRLLSNTSNTVDIWRFVVSRADNLTISNHLCRFSSGCVEDIRTARVARIARLIQGRADGASPDSAN